MSCGHGVGNVKIYIPGGGDTMCWDIIGVGYNTNEVVDMLTIKYWLGARCEYHEATTINVKLNEDWHNFDAHTAHFSNCGMPRSAWKHSTNHRVTRMRSMADRVLIITLLDLEMKHSMGDFFLDEDTHNDRRSDLLHQRASIIHDYGVNELDDFERRNRIIYDFERRNPTIRNVNDDDDYLNEDSEVDENVAMDVDAENDEVMCDPVARSQTGRDHVDDDEDDDKDDDNDDDDDEDYVPETI